MTLSTVYPLPMRKRLRWRVREEIAASPRLWRAFHRHFGNTEDITERDTGIVVEGYPRSGNSFAEAAVSLLDPDVKIAHHRHVAAQFKFAQRWNIPALLLIREPTKAAASAVYRAPDELDPRMAMRQWISFHRACLPILNSVVVSDFPTTTGNFEIVVKTLNSRFGMSLPLPDDNFVQQAYAMIEKLSQARRSSRLNYTATMGENLRAERRGAIETIRGELIKSMPDITKQAQDLFARLKEHAL